MVPRPCRHRLVVVDGPSVCLRCRPGCAFLPAACSGLQSRPHAHVWSMPRRRFPHFHCLLFRKSCRPVRPRRVGRQPVHRSAATSGTTASLRRHRRPSILRPLRSSARRSHSTTRRTCLVVSAFFTFPGVALSESAAFSLLRFLVPVTADVRSPLCVGQLFLFQVERAFDLKN